MCVRTRQLLCVVCLFAPRASRLLGRIVLAVHVLLGSRVCACLCFWFCVDAIFVFFSFALDLLLFSVGGEEGDGFNHHPAVCRATSASASVCESCVCHVVAVWSRVRRRFGSSAGRILNVYTYTYTSVYVRACNCVRLNMF